MAWTMPVAGNVYGRVEASQSWLVTFEQGRVGTRFVQGTAALGPETTSMEMFAFDRLGRLSLQRVAEPGTAVQPGATVAKVSSDLGPDQIKALQAQVDELKARRDLLNAGGRQETIARVQSELRAAVQARRLIQNDLERSEGLVASGAVSAAVVADLRTRDAQAQATIAAKEAALNEAKLPPRPEQLKEIDAQIASAEAEVRVAEAGSGARELKAPIAGTVIRGDLPCDPLDPVCVATDPVPALLQVVVSDPVVVRVPWPGTNPPAAGSFVNLKAPNGDHIEASVQDIGPIQRDPTGLPYVPISVVVPNPDGRLTVGSLVEVRSARSWMGLL